MDSSPQPSVENLATGVLCGDRSLLGRAITLVESDREDHREKAQELLLRLVEERPEGLDSHRVGITGVPGVGKSTFIDALGMELLERGERVAVLAVDPSSTISGGSILGDKTRMPRLAREEGAFIRPSPSSGSLGGVARKTRETLAVCEAAGFRLVLVETVGVGQSETAVAGMVDAFLVLMLAGAGDELQGIKRGLLELADVIAINKADGENLEPAERAAAEYAAALRYLRPATACWRPRVVTVSAKEGRGVAALWDLLLEHRRALEGAGQLASRRRHQRLGWMWQTLEEELLVDLRRDPRVAELLPEVESRVLDGTLTPPLAARRILDTFRSAR